MYVTAKDRSTRPRILAGGLVAFVALSAANVLPPVAQAGLYAVGLLALAQRPHRLPLYEMALLAVATGYIVLLRSALNVDLDGSFRLLRPCFEGLLAAHVLYTWCRIRSFNDTVRLLGVFVALQFTIAILMAANPAARLEFINGVYSDEAYHGSQLAGALLFRGYGLSRHHLYGLPLAGGLVAALLLVLASTETSWRRLAAGALAIPAMLLVAVNARIGLVPVLLCYGAGILLVSGYYAKHLVTTALLILLPAALLGAAFLGDDFEAVMDWLASGALQFGADSGDSTTFGDLQRMFIISSNLPDMIFGLGSPCSTDMHCYSDIGIVRALQEGGLVLLALILTLYWRMCTHAIDLLRSTTSLTSTRKRQVARLLTVVVFGTFIAAMVKGEAYGASDYSRLVAMLACLGVLVARHNRVAVKQTGQLPVVPLPMPQPAP